MLKSPPLSGFFLLTPNQMNQELVERKTTVYFYTHPTMDNKNFTRTILGQICFTTGQQSWEAKADAVSLHGTSSNRGSQSWLSIG
jgi:hypothetical protein